MGIVPNDRVKKIEFYEAHITPWTSNAAAVGLNPAVIATLSAAITSARSAYNAHVAAQSAAKAATAAFYDKVRIMHASPGLGADMIQTIKTYAQTTNNPNVYVLAQIPAPTPPSPVPAPGTPESFTVGLQQNGAVELKWKCANPAGSVGVVYEIQRSIGGGGGGGGGAGSYSFVGTSGARSFTDTTLPQGASPVTYQITAVRSTSRGAPAQFTVNFGSVGGSLTIASVTPSGNSGESNGGGIQLAA